MPTFAPVMVPTQHAYILNNNGGKIGVYTLPLSAGEQPNFTAGAVANPLQLAVDSTGNVADALFNDVTVYLAPFSASSTPSATIMLPLGQSVAQLAFFGGKLYAGIYSGTVDVLAPPYVTGVATPAVITPLGLTATGGIAFDPSGTLYVSNHATNFSAPSNIIALPPPYTATTVATPAVAGALYGAVVATATQLFVAQTASGTGTVDVYTLPLTAASVPAFSITSGINVPFYLAVDATGKLYVGNTGSDAVTVFAPPFSASSAPTTTLSLPQSFFLNGVAIGP